MTASLRRIIHSKKMQYWSLQEWSDSWDENHHVSKKGDPCSDCHKGISHTFNPAYMEGSKGGIVFDLLQCCSPEDTSHKKHHGYKKNKYPLDGIQVQDNTACNNWDDK